MGCKYTVINTQSAITIHFCVTLKMCLCVDDMLLLGTIHRRELHRALDDILCLEKKLAYFSHKLGLSTNLEPICSISSQMSSQLEECQVRYSPQLIVVTL